MDNKIKDNIKSVFDGVTALSNTKQVIGEPYIVGETTIIPFLETSLGAGFGEFNADKEASGLACKIKPIACLVIQNGFTKLINISNSDSISKALDLIPDLVDKLTKKGVYDKGIDEAIDEIKENYN